MALEHDNGGIVDGGTVQPLTRRNADEIAYVRTDEVERQIAEAVRLTPRQIIAHAQVDDKDAGDYLREEALVYLIRASQACSDAATVDALFETLLRRCLPLLKRRLGSLGAQAFEEAYADCVTDLATRILDLESDRGDFLQVRFWLALDRLATSAFTRHQKQRQQSDYTVPIGADSEDDDGDARARAIDPAAATPSIPDLAEYREGLNAIDEPYRMAFVLRYYHGWPTEDDDPTVPTLSRYFKKTPRTIRNYLRRADEALLAWRGEHA